MCKFYGKLGGKIAQWHDSCALILRPVVRDSPQLNIHFDRGESLSFSDSRSGNHEVLSHREEGPGRCSPSKKLLSVKMSAFGIQVESYGCKKWYETETSKVKMSSRPPASVAAHT